MQQIKFRGVDLNGETHCGDLVQSNFGLLPATHYFILHNGYQHEVKPETVAQLVGYDSNGAEVYEGDTLIDAFDNQYEVQFYPMGVNDDDCINLADSAKLNLTLKEAQS